MPGPSNTKGKRKASGKAQKKKLQRICSSGKPPSSTLAFDRDDSSSPSLDTPVRLLTPPPTHPLVEREIEIRPINTELDEHEGLHWQYTLPEPKETQPPMPQIPFIHDPGNGPRVRDTRAFLSSFFAQPPAHDDPLCAEFAQEEVLEMLMTILPEEMALVLWYNKSRSTSRVCPACQRLYRLGDILPNHFSSYDTLDSSGMDSSPKLAQEQALSGLCSPMCFILASYSYPNAIKSAWGCTADELDDYTWALLNGPAQQTTGDHGLTMLMRMTRLHDLGLAQLCLGVDSEDLDDLQENGDPTL